MFSYTKQNKGGVSLDIGKRIKSLRVKNGLTLEELASRTELTKGFLSQLERNLTSPSITTLEDIVEVLGISLELFFKEEKELKITFDNNDYFVDERDNATVTWIVPNAQKNDMEPILLTLEHEGESHEVKPHEGEEFGYVLKGRVILKDLTNKIEYGLKKGETFYMKGDFRHLIVNESGNEAKLLWICTPPIF